MIFQYRQRLLGRARWPYQTGYLIVLLGVVTGCATFDQKTGFADLSAAVQDRSGMQVAWNLGIEPDAQVAEKIRELSAGKLTVDTATQMALLNNRRLQATYAELGVAQADLVQAGLLENPLFDLAAKFPLEGGGPNLELGVALGFLNVFYMPLRKRVASAQFEAAKFRVTGEVIDFVADVRSAFYRHQANAQQVELQQAIVHSLAAALDVAQRLREAGNITDLDLARERALAEEAKLQLAAAEMALRQSREQLNDLMGFWGQQTAWTIDQRLPDIPAQPISIEGLERQTISKSLDLDSARQSMIVAGERLGFNRAAAFLPDAETGAVAERDEGEWEVGPTLEFPLPLFDQGQARIGRGAVELRRAQQAYYALAVRIRSVARAVRDRVQSARGRALYYRDILLPLRERIVNESQLQYNAMQMGVFDLIRAKEQQVQTAVAYIETQLDYWLARVDLDQLLSGRLPRSSGAESVVSARSTRVAENGDH
jgi:cobalt-zinc-cadmium efflux system outer membrane protein